MSYPLHDHLGSVVGILDDKGFLQQDLAFDAWGARKRAVNSQETLDLGTSMLLFKRLHETTRRGFTGHEMLDEVGLIHMNGRLYDPRIGRFLSADSLVQAPGDTQSYNRYAYVRNNPLNATDPSGYFLRKIFKKVIRAAVKIFGAELVNLVGTAVSAYFGQAWGVAAWTFAFNQAMGVPFGQSLRAAAIAGISAYAFQAIGASDLSGPGKVLAHGVTSGITAELQGESFGHGFFSAGLSKLVMGQFKYKDTSWRAIAGRTTVAAAVGGTISEVTGGKFANGARTAAMAHLLNGERSAIRERLAAQQTKDTWDPVTNERIKGLHPDVQGNATNFVNEVESELGIQLRVTQGTRTSAEQDALYAQGRTAPDQIVTDARGGKSYHNYGLAIDVVEIRGGQAVWEINNWQTIGGIGTRNGFEWGGNWRKPDMPHFQRTFGLSIGDLQGGARP